MTEYKLLYITESEKTDKKFVATFLNKNTNRIKRVHFGAHGYEDYTIHKDKKRREKYINRHKNDRIYDPITPGALSYHILWVNLQN